ncbi:unnamed protein product [Microthlaspi erraticum]|uniref:Uncharacterized protein n=1 Tax=Microthlaspi erraticum TaxID=1685480 RepID=A0A6D2KLY0_9BRAS|nr:unnamed protein product [Microthlaspi erraticum]
MNPSIHNPLSHSLTFFDLMWFKLPRVTENVAWKIPMLLQSGHIPGRPGEKGLGFGWGILEKGEIVFNTIKAHCQEDWLLSQETRNECYD